MTDNTPQERNDTARLKAIFVLCGALAFAVAPLMSDPFTGWEPDAFPNPTPPLPLQPAGYAFAIWGVIYAWLLAHGFFGLIKRDIDDGWDRTRAPLFVALAIGSAWLGIARTSPVMATVTIFLMLGGALIAMMRAPADRDSWLLKAPIGLFAGWLSAASFVAAATVLAGWTGLSATLASFLGLGGVVVLASLVARARPPVTYHIALAWALVGVAVASFGMEGSNGVFTGTALAAAIGIVVMGARQVLDRG